MKNKKVFFLSGLAIAVLSFLSGCTFFNSDKPPLPGQRESIFNINNLPKEDALAHKPGKLKYAKNKNWTVAGGALSHATGPLVLDSDFSRKSYESFSIKSSGAIYFMQPLIKGDMLYLLSCRNEVFALDKESLETKWKFRPSLEVDCPLVGGIGIYGNKVVLVTPEGKIFALARKTGELVWSKDFAEPMRGAPTFSDNNVILQSKDNKVYALSTESGELVWTFSASLEGLSFLKNSNAAVLDGRVLTVLTSGDVVMLRGDNGAVLWRDKLDAHANKDELSLILNTQALPVLEDIYAFIFSQQQLVVFDQRNGRQLWEEPIGGHLEPAVTKKHLFIIDDRGYLMALEKNNGKTSWITKLPSFKKQRFGPYVTSSGVLVFNDDKALFFETKDGILQKEVSLNACPVTPPIIVDNALYVLDSDQHISVYR